jgi:hypothetical protein
LIRGPPRNWIKLLRNHIGSPIVFGHVFMRNSIEWNKEIDLGLCFLLKVSGKHYDARNQYNDCYVSTSSSSHDFVVEVLSCQGVVQVRTSYLTTKLLSKDGEFVWPKTANFVETKCSAE